MGLQGVIETTAIQLRQHGLLTGQANGKRRRIEGSGTDRTDIENSGWRQVDRHIAVTFRIAGRRPKQTTCPGRANTQAKCPRKKKVNHMMRVTDTDTQIKNRLTQNRERYENKK